MRKHIKVKAELLSDRETVKITFLEQSHFGREFGNRVESVYSAFEHRCPDLIMLICLTNGNALRGYIDYNRLWFPEAPEYLGSSVITTADRWPFFKAAIEAYNNTEF